MKRWCFTLLTLLIGAAIISGCDTLQQPTREVVVPTLLVLPSETPTPDISPTPETPTLLPTATDTPIPSETPTFTPPPNPDELTATAVIGLVLTREILSLTPPTATSTDTPTATETPSPTATNTPPLTFTPSRTRTPSNTPRPTINPFAFTRTAVISIIQTRYVLSQTPPPSPTPTNTPTATATPPATFTPTPTATSAEPVINSFAASQLTAPANGILTFSWTANADSARLETLTAAGAVIASVPVQPNVGTAQLTVPGNYGRIISYRLVVARAGIERSALLNVTIVCQFTFFFGDQFAPPDADCPQDFGQVGNGAIQTFQNGTMIYVNASGRNEIYILSNTGASFIRIPNNWDGVTEDTTPAPDGLLIPEDMFNWAYYNTTPPFGGTWNQVLGWAVTPIDLSQRSIQFETNLLDFYIDAPGGVLFRLTTQSGNTGSWIRIR